MNESSNLSELVQSCKNTIDLTQKSDMNRLQEIVLQMNDFPVLEIEKIGLDKVSPLEFKVGYKILKSKNYRM